MFDNIILIFMLVMLLLGAAMLALPIPLLWGMLCLIFIGLSVVQRRQPSQ